jgi:hypothetical protein
MTPCTGCTFADGSLQRPYFSKETSSATVSSEALMYTILIDPKERRDVATADVVGAYLNADMDDFTLMKLTGDAVNIMLQVHSSYKSLSLKKMANLHCTFNSRRLYMVAPSQTYCGTSYFLERYRTWG